MEEDTTTLDDRRVKLYYLDAEGEWEEKGTGHIALNSIEVDDVTEHEIIIRSELPNDAEGTESQLQILLQTKISKDDIYDRQDVTLLVWNDPQISKDIAVSFQSPAGCLQIFTEICTAQGRTFGSDDNLSKSETELAVSDSNSSVGGFILPEPSPGTLCAIADLFRCMPPSSRETMAKAVLAEGFLGKLFDCFAQCEDLEDIESLHVLFRICQFLVLLNSVPVFRTLFGEDNIEKVLGILEFDPDLNCKQNYRHFLRNVAKCRNVLQLSTLIQNQVTQAYRLQYLRDSVLARWMDDPTFATINAFVLLYHDDILRTLVSDTACMTELFRLLNETSETEPLRYLIMFCQEMVQMSKILQVKPKNELFCTLSEKGLFSAAGNLILSSDARSCMAAADILWQTAHQEALILRAFLIGEAEDGRENCCLRNMVIALAKNDNNEPLKGQLVDILKLLLEATGDRTHQSETAQFLQLFYDGNPSILDLVAASVLHPKIDTECITQYYALDLLSFCVETHTYRMKNFVLHSNMVGKVLKFLHHCAPQHLTLAALRFFRAVVNCRDDFYNRHLIKHNYFAPLVEIFCSRAKVKDRYNVLNSAILCIFEIIRKENIKLLVAHIVETFGTQLTDIDYVDTFKGILQKHNNHQEKANDQSATEEGTAGDSTSSFSPCIIREPTAAAMRTNGPFKDLRDDEDEDYFSKETDDDDQEEYEKYKSDKEELFDKVIECQDDDEDDDFEKNKEEVVDKIIEFRDDDEEDYEKLKLAKEAAEENTEIDTRSENNDFDKSQLCAVTTDPTAAPSKNVNDVIDRPFDVLLEDLFDSKEKVNEEKDLDFVQSRKRKRSPSPTQQEIILLAALSSKEEQTSEEKNLTLVCDLPLQDDDEELK